jgi:tRNA A58 N-methylase Trm61
LELTSETAAFARGNLRTWGHEDRVSIEVSDVREYTERGAFDLVTF